MFLKLKCSAAIARQLGVCFILLGTSAFAEPLAIEEVLGVLGINKSQIAELEQGQPIAYALSEGRDDELAMGVVRYMPVPLEKVTEHYRLDNPESLDVDVSAHGLLTEQGGADALASVTFSSEEAQAFLDFEPGDEFNLSVPEIDSSKTLDKMLKRTPYRPIEDEVGQHFREILFNRFKAYRRGGANALAPYAREGGLDSKPALELRRAADASAILAHYLPVLHKVWLDYPKALPQQADEAFPWVEKKVEGRTAVILRHRIKVDWNGGILVLTREFYASHSYNSSQWITGCIPYHDGTLVFQQVRSYTDQVAGVGSDVKHLVGRELLKNKMLKFFERLCGVLPECH